MLQIPEELGMYVQLSDKDEYIKLTAFECNVSSQRERHGRLTDRYHYFSIPAFDSATVIKTKSLDGIHFYQFTKIPFILAEPSENGVIVRAKQVFRSLSANVIKPVKAETEEISKNYRRKHFIPEYGKTYVYANVDNSSMLGRKISPKVYIFGFEQE